MTWHRDIDKTSYEICSLYIFTLPLSASHRAISEAVTSYYFVRYYHVLVSHFSKCVEHKRPRFDLGPSRLGLFHQSSSSSGHIRKVLIICGWLLKIAGRHCGFDWMPRNGLWREKKCYGANDGTRMEWRTRFMVEFWFVAIYGVVTRAICAKCAGGLGRELEQPYFI